MKAILKIELRDDNLLQYIKFWSSITDDLLGKNVGNAVFGKWPTPCWVAEITGYDKKYKYARKFVKYKKDYSKSNSKGSRGVYAVFILSENRIYEVRDNKNRYFCTVKDWTTVKINTGEVEQWLNNHSA